MMPVLNGNVVPLSVTLVSASDLAYLLLQIAKQLRIKHGLPGDFPRYVYLTDLRLRHPYRVAHVDLLRQNHSHPVPLWEV
jgi:hypothetical protein